jgi:hypothetical protein
MKPTFNISPDEKKPELYNAKIRPQYCMPILLRPDGAFRFIPAASEKSGALRKPSSSRTQSFRCLGSLYSTN